MNRWRWLPLRIRLLWRNLDINGKFTSAFLGLLLLIGGVATTGWVSLYFVRRETEAAIVSSIELQRLVFQMNQELDVARRQEREFFRTWSTSSFLDTSRNYAREHQQQITKILRISDELQKLIAGANVSLALRQSNPEVLAYVEMVQKYASSFREAVGLVGDLGMDQTGVLARMDQQSELLYQTLQITQDLQLIALYSQMKITEKEYLLNNDQESMNSLNKAVEALRLAMIRSPGLDANRQMKAMEYLQNYIALAEKIITLDVEIRSKIESFDEQAVSFSQKLIQLSSEEIERAQSQIGQTSLWATMLLVASLVLALVMAAVISNEFWLALMRLEAEQQKSERLLLNILPKPIAERLKHKEQTIADNFADVTVLFADIAGFTVLSTHLTPTELVQLLNEIFSAFDSLVEKHGLEKIKTIGDAYMVVGGLPDPCEDHAQAIAEMALDMQQEIEQFNAKHNADLSIRIGINTGPVVAGVIGTKKFIYDLWGDAVNTASRMESHGIVGSIQISATTYERLRDRYLIEERGVIQVKGKGQMMTYILKDRKVATPFLLPQLPIYNDL